MFFRETNHHRYKRLAMILFICSCKCESKKWTENKEKLRKLPRNYKIECNKFDEVISNPEKRLNAFIVEWTQKQAKSLVCVWRYTFWSTLLSIIMYTIYPTHAIDCIFAAKCILPQIHLKMYGKYGKNKMWNKCTDNAQCCCCNIKPLKTSKTTQHKHK